LYDLVGCGIFGYGVVFVSVGPCGCGIGRVGGFGCCVAGVLGWGGSGRFGNVGGISLASLTARSPMYYSILSSITAGFLCRSNFIYTSESFLQYTIISSPLSSTLVSVFLILWYIVILFFFISGDRWAHTFIGVLYSFRAPNSILRSARSGAARTRRGSYGAWILLNLFMSIILLMYPNVIFIVYCQLSCSDFHPYIPPSRSILLMYSHSCLSFSVNS
jgi:hypothetical protein